MTYYQIDKNKSLQTKLRGKALLDHPILNKGTAFPSEERSKLGLHGLIPARIETLQQQAARYYHAYQQKTEDLSRHIFLRELQDRNETCFYRLLADHTEEMLPMIYTPVVGLACQRFSEIYRRGRGIFVSYPERGKMDEMIQNIELPDVKVIVVSDGERILGLGDQGIGGMGIPIGKISLYSACGGIFPGVALPIILDVGTDNEERLNNPFYLGWKHKRIRGKEYDDFIDQFVHAVLKRYPNVLLQWEDFSKDHARAILDRYKNACCTFNDDIQGTAAVTLAGILTGIKIQKKSFKAQQILIYGAGSAGTGIADEIVLEMKRQGIKEEEATRQIWMFGSKGLLHTAMPDLSPAQKPYAHPKELLLSLKMDPTKKIALEDAIEHIKPTILIGVSGAANAFSEKAIRSMTKFTERPIVFPLSNPLSHCEANPADLVKWTNGKALIATGTPAPEVSYQGKTLKISQCNNYYIFPAMGLAILAVKATRVTDNMFLAAAENLSSLSPALQNDNAPLFPPPHQIQTLSKKLAFAIAKQAIRDNVAKELSDAALTAAIEQTFWEPKYIPIQGI